MCGEQNHTFVSTGKLQQKPKQKAFAKTRDIYNYHLSYIFRLDPPLHFHWKLLRTTAGVKDKKL